MNILVGVGLFTAGLLVFSALFRAMRRPGARPWLNNEWVGSASALVLTATFAFSLGQIAVGASDPAAQIAGIGWTPAVGLAIGAIVALGLSAWLFASGRRLSAMARTWRALDPVSYPLNGGKLQAANESGAAVHERVA